MQGEIGGDENWEIELEQSGERVEVWEIDCLLELLFQLGFGVRSQGKELDSFDEENMKGLMESLVDIWVDVLGFVDEVDYPDNISHCKCSLLD